MCPLQRTLASLARSQALTGGLTNLGCWGERPWMAPSQQVIAPSPEQGPHTDQKLLFSSLTPLSCKLPPCPRCLPTLLQACNLNRGLEKPGKNPESPCPCHLGSPGLAVCSYFRRMVFRGPFWWVSASPKSLTLTSPTFNPLMVSFVSEFSGSNSLQIQDLSHVSGTPAACG